MIKAIRKILAAAFVVASIGVASPVLSSPVASAGPCVERLLTFPTWYKGLTEMRGGDCVIKSPGTDLSGFVWKIVLNIIEIALQLVAYIAVGFIIYGGFQYIVSGESSDGMGKAKTTILNAIIGLVIAIFSVAIVNIAGGAIK